MGLGGVELVMAVEEEFGIAIDDRDAERIRTVGEFWDYICERVSFVPTQACASAASFYRLRRAFMATISVTRASFCPDALLEPMLPLQDRRAAWKKLGETAGIKLPALELPQRIERAQIWAIIGLPLLAMIFLTSSGHHLLAVITFVVGIILISRLSNRLVVPWQARFNPAWTTAGGLSQAVVGLNPTVWNVPATHSREIARERLRAIIAETLGVSLDLVQPEASFVNDLGLD